MSTEILVEKVYPSFGFKTVKAYGGGAANMYAKTKDIAEKTKCIDLIDLNNL